jgi:cyclase
MHDVQSAFNPFRVIPCLQVDRGRLVKTTGYRNPSYVGDLINSLRIFNEKEVDEISVVDISATRERRGPDFELINEMASECFMPLAYGGGITTVSEIERIIQLGVEKVILNSAALENLDLLRAAAASVGSQSVVVSIDVKKQWLGGYCVFTRSGTKRIGGDLFRTVDAVTEAGAGELLLNAIDKDGTMGGYDHALIKAVTERTTLPVIAAGGASGPADLVRAVQQSGASAVAAGALFVYRGPHRAVLLSYPSARDIRAYLTDTN